MTARGPTVTTPLAGDDGTSAPVPVLIGGRREMMYRCTAPNCPKAYRQASDLRTHNQLRHPTANSALSASSNAVNGNNNNNINNNNISNSASTLLSASAADAIVVGSPTGSPLLGNAHAHASSLSNSGGGVGAVGPGAMDEIRAWLSSPRVALPQIAIAQLTALLEVRKKFRLVDLRGWDEAAFRNIGFNQVVHIPKLVRALEAEFGGPPIRASPMLQPRLPPPGLHTSSPPPQLSSMAGDDNNYVALPVARLLNSSGPNSAATGAGGGGGGGGIADDDHYVDLRLTPMAPMPPLPPLPMSKSPAPPTPPARPLSPSAMSPADHYNLFPQSERAKSQRDPGSDAAAAARNLMRRNTASSISQPNIVLSAPPIAGLPGVGMNRGMPSPRVPPGVQQSPMRRNSPMPAPASPAATQPPPSPSPPTIGGGAAQNQANPNYSLIALPESEREADPRKRWYFHDVRRDEAEAMLRGRAAGTFVMRPSSQAQFALTFVTDRQDFGHALVYHMPQGWQLESLSEFHPTLDALLQKYTLLNWDESSRLAHGGGFGNR